MGFADAHSPNYTHHLYTHHFTQGFAGWVTGWLDECKKMGLPIYGTITESIEITEIIEIIEITESIEILESIKITEGHHHTAYTPMHRHAHTSFAYCRGDPPRVH
jgi:hypothetical protein